MVRESKKTRRDKFALREIYFFFRLSHQPRSIQTTPIPARVGIGHWRTPVFGRFLFGFLLG